MMGKKLKSERTFTCENCNVGEMEVKQMLAHMKDVHGLEGDGLKGNRSMVAHMDGRDWYRSTYRWEFGDVVVIESCWNERAADDMMRMA